MKDLFGGDTLLPNEERGTPRMAERQHAQLCSIYGKIDNKKCKHCANLVERHIGKIVYKCSLAYMSRSESTDWRVGWTACGKFIQR